MKHHRISLSNLCLPFLALLVLFVSCEKEYLHRGGSKDITINATIEQPFDRDEKVFLSDEQWIYWELGDQISIGSQLSTEAVAGDLVNSNPGTDFEDFNGIFIVPLPEGSEKFLGLHPYNEGNSIVGTGSSSPYFETPTLVLPATQPVRNDSTFSRSIFPMVAWYGGEWNADDPTPFNLDFHSLGTIVRVQLFNQAAAATINSIEFTSLYDTRKLSGSFSVHDFTSFYPYLSGGDSPTVTITCGEDGINFPANELRSFYLVLPATSAQGTIVDSLRMTVNATVSGETKVFTKRFKVSTRRSGITYMRALGVTSWDEATVSAGLVGNGTSTRPFKIYSLADLQYLRNCYNSVERKINGQPITANTHVALMRSDIELGTYTWSTGINDFIGVFTSRITAAGEKGITNSSQHPLFESVGTGGTIDGLTVISGITYSTLSGDGFSPFCLVNNGTIKNSNLLPDEENGLTSTYINLAGICVTNNGTLRGCSNSSSMTVGSGLHVGGICLVNSENSTITDCQVTSEFAVTGNALVGGICYQNNGTVKDCFYGATNAASTASWGAIVYTNAATVEHCYCSHTSAIITTGTVGGIVNTCTGGTLDYCYTEGRLQGKAMGGIAVEVSGGKLINCYVNHSQAQLTLNASAASDCGGGLVGSLSGGNIQNSYVYISTVRQMGTTGTHGGLVGKITGGKVSNCYVYERSSSVHSFYGSVDNVGTRLENCYLVAGSQNGTSSVATDAVEGLQTNLNTNKTSLSGAKAWTGASNSTPTPPSLEAYTVTP